MTQKATPSSQPEPENLDPFFDLGNKFLSNAIAFYEQPDVKGQLNENGNNFVKDLYKTTARWESGQRDAEVQESIFNLTEQFTYMSIQHNGRSIMQECMPEELRHLAASRVIIGQGDIESERADMWINLAAPEHLQ